MKPEDRAQELELEEWERNQQRAIRTLPDKPSATECVDCGEAIPKARRLAIPGVETCVYCQQFKEGRYR